MKSIALFSNSCELENGIKQVIGNVKFTPRHLTQKCE